LRFIAVLLAIGLVWVQAQTWFGQRSAARVTELRTQLDAQQEANARAREAQTRARAELKDLREGLEIPDWFSFPEVVQELRRTSPPTASATSTASSAIAR